MAVWILTQHVLESFESFHKLVIGRDNKEMLVTDDLNHHVTHYALSSIKLPIIACTSETSSDCASLAAWAIEAWILRGSSIMQSSLSDIL